MFGVRGEIIILVILLDQIVNVPLTDGYQARPQKPTCLSESNQ